MTVRGTCLKRMLNRELIRTLRLYLSLTIVKLMREAKAPLNSKLRILWWMILMMIIGNNEN